MSASKALSTAPSSRQPSAGGARGAVTGGAKAGVDRRGAPSTAPAAGSRQGTFNFAYSARQAPRSQGASTGPGSAMLIVRAASGVQGTHAVHPGCRKALASV